MKHTLVKAVTAKLCGVTGEKFMLVIAPNSLIWMGACEKCSKDMNKTKTKAKVQHCCSHH